jgi:hypothetical protein
VHISQKRRLTLNHDCARPHLPKTCWTFSWTLGWLDLDLDLESSPPLFVCLLTTGRPRVYALSKIGSPLLRVEWTVVVLFAIALELAAGRK